MSKLRSDSNIYVFGAGMIAGKVIRRLLYDGVAIQAAIVTETDKNPKQILGIKVIGINEICPDNKTVVILGVSDKIKMEVEASLRAKGIKTIVREVEGISKWQLNRTFPKIEITTQIGCSVNCRFCPQKELINRYFSNTIKSNSELTLEKFQRCISNMPSNSIITFSGFSEPFLNEATVDMIHYANQNGMEIELFTTFRGLKYKDFLTLLDVPFREVVLHAPDQDNYASIPVTEDYRMIVDKALSYRKSDGEPFVDSCNSQGEPSDEFERINNGRIKTSFDLIDRAGILESDKLKKSKYKQGKIVCNRSAIQNHWVLLPDGRVVLCCMDFGMRHVLGNLLEQSYDEIMESEPYKKIRASMTDFSLIPDLLCRNCTSSKEIQ